MPSSVSLEKEPAIKSIFFIKNLVGDYILDRVIGQGTYGKVRLGIHEKTGEKAFYNLI